MPGAQGVCRVTKGAPMFGESWAERHTGTGRSRGREQGCWGGLHPKNQVGRMKETQGFGPAGVHGGQRSVPMNGTGLRVPAQGSGEASQGGSLPPSPLPPQNLWPGLCEGLSN